MVIKLEKKTIIVFGGLLFLILINLKPSAAAGISMNFIKTNISLNQSDRNWVNFKMRNVYGTTLYYTTVNDSHDIAGLETLIDPSEINEFNDSDEIDMVMLVTTNQTILSGNYRIKIWAEGRDENWGRATSPEYYVYVDVFSNYISTTTTTSSTTSSTTTSVTTTTIKSFLNETFSETLGKKISKNQILIIVAIVMIALVVLPMISFKKEPKEVIVHKSKEKSKEVLKEVEKLEIETPKEEVEEKEEVMLDTKELEEKEVMEKEEEKPEKELEESKDEEKKAEEK